MSVPYKRFDELELHESQEVQVRVFDNTIETFRVNQKETPPNICWSLVGEKYGQTLNWIIVEVWRNEGIERPLENHESLFKIQRERIMGHEENRYLTFRSKHEMFTMFKEPEEYHELYKTYDVPMIEKIRLAQLAMDGEISPLYYNQVWIYDSNKTNPSWEQKVLLVMDKKLYFSTCYEPIAALVIEFEKIRMLNSKNSSRVKYPDRFIVDKVEYWSSLSDCEVFYYNNANTTIAKSPANFNLCLVFNSGVKQYISCDHGLQLKYWMCAMRLSKYGKQLRDNYRSFIKKQSDPNDYEYNKKPMPNESIRSHVAMDFRGNVGRIVEDPVEAQAIAQAELGNARRCHRNNSRNTPGLQAAVTRLDINVHLSQPWYHKTMSRNQATCVLNALEDKDGIFLIRESGRNDGSFVLSFKSNGKIIHLPIISQNDSLNDGQICFTLDSGHTKFYDLLQLVEFYQLNVGNLPTRLMYYVVQVPANQ